MEEEIQHAMMEVVRAMNVKNINFLETGGVSFWYKGCTVELNYKIKKDRKSTR